MSAANEVVEVEIEVMVDADGNWEIGRDADDLKARWEENVGELTATATRLITVKVKVPRPRVVELEAEIADEPADAELKVA